MKTIRHEPIYRVNPDADTERLYNIVKQTNAYIARGEECVLTLGHSGDDPDMMAVSCGYLDNFVVDGNTLYADMNIDDMWEDARELKGRRKKSLEIWEDDIASCCALLCKNRPALELGLVAYEMPERDGMHHESYKYNEESEEDMKVEMMDVAEVKQLFEETLAHSDFIAKFNELCDRIVPTLSEKLTKLEDTLGPLLVEESLEEGHEDIAPELDAEGKELEADEVADDDMTTGDMPDTPEPELADGMEPEKNDATASANNTYTPGFDGPKKDKEDEDEKRKKLGEKKALDKYQLEVVAVLEERNELLKKYQREVRKGELKDLLKDFKFEVDEELDLVEDLSDEQFANHKKIIVTRYQRAPVGRTVSPVTMIADPNEISVRADKAARAKDYALANNVTFQAAMKAVS